jgi:UDP-N-acetylmuramoylalanine--D-glutamate ligase
MRLDGRRTLVVGAGKSGVAAAQFLVERGARVTVTDRRPAGEMQAARAQLGERVAWQLGAHEQSSFLAADLIVVSPGVPRLPEIASASQKGAEIIGEIELASRFIEAPIVGVTGTNGKSTVTAMCGEIARTTGRPTFVGGNLGTPLITAVGTDAARAGGLCVVELSSFQLETCETLHPRAAVLTNVTPDHLDRYANMDEYSFAKIRVAQRMTASDAFVINHDDPGAEQAFKQLLSLRMLREDPQAAIRTVHEMTWRYSLVQPLGEERGVWIHDGHFKLRIGGADERIPLDELHAVGRHNQSNALAALLALRASGLATHEQARAGLAAFRALPHRMQLVGERRGVRFYDDSKATNVDSVVAGVDGFPVPFVLIAGGRDKGGSYAPLVAALQHNSCRAVLLIGEAADKIAAALGTTVAHERLPSLEAAVARGAELVSAGEAVVLSPACSSYDMFQNYEHRGRAFRAAVERLT